MDENETWSPERIPVDVAERLMRARGHCNASERYLWNDIGRGLWSAMQARARIAEAWLMLTGQGDELPPVANKQPSEDCQQRFVEFVAAEPPKALLAAWDAVAELEQAVLAWGECFPRDTSDESSFQQGMDCASLFQKALGELLQQVEGLALETCWPSEIEIGDWLVMADGRQAELLGFSGLWVHVFLPEGSRNGRSWKTTFDLRYANFRRLPNPPPWPLGCRLSFWLKRAAGALLSVENMWMTENGAGALARSQSSPAACARLLGESLCALDMAWLTMLDPCGVDALRELAYEDMEWRSQLADPLIQARAERILKALKNWRGEHKLSTEPQRGWLELVPIYEQLRSLLADSENLLVTGVSPVWGEWFGLNDGPPARLAARVDDVAILVDSSARIRCQTFFSLHHLDDSSRDRHPWPAQAELRLRRAALAHRLGEYLLCNCCGLPGQVVAEPNCLICGWHEPRSDVECHWRNQWQSRSEVRARLLQYAEATGLAGDGALNCPEQVQLRRRLLWLLGGWLDRGAPVSDAEPIMALWHSYLNSMEKGGDDGKV